MRCIVWLCRKKIEGHVVIMSYVVFSRKLPTVQGPPFMEDPPPNIWAVNFHFLFSFRHNIREVMTYNIFKVRNKNGSLRLRYSGGGPPWKGVLEWAVASYPFNLKNSIWWYIQKALWILCRVVNYIIQDYIFTMRSGCSLYFSTRSWMKGSFLVASVKV